jgi:hypothetical protein
MIEQKKCVSPIEEVTQAGYKFQRDRIFFNIYVLKAVEIQMLSRKSISENTNVSLTWISNHLNDEKFRKDALEKNRSAVLPIYINKESHQKHSPLITLS